MFLFGVLSKYWEETKFPISSLLHENHTVFSEESGEIALSLLARGTPAASRAKLSQVQHQWQMLKMQFDCHSDLSSQEKSDKSIVSSVRSLLFRRKILFNFLFVL